MFKRKAFTLVEVMLALSVILFLITAIIFTYNIVNRKEKVSSSIDTLSSIRKNLKILSAVDSDINNYSKMLSYVIIDLKPIYYGLQKNIIKRFLSSMKAIQVKPLAGTE